MIGHIFFAMFSDASPKKQNLKVPFVHLMKIMRFLPTVELFSAVWTAFLRACEEQWNSSGFATYLLREYTHTMPSHLLHTRFAIHCRSQDSMQIAVCLWWAGTTGCVPGTASGTQAVESFHRPWEQETKAMGAPSNIKVVLNRMQKLYNMWGDAERLHWPSDVYFLEPGYDSALWDPQLLRSMHRSPPEEFFAHRTLPNFQECVSPIWGPLVVVAANARTQVDVDFAASYQRLLDLTFDELEQHLCRVGVITLNGEFSVEGFNRMFCSLVVVFLRPTATAQNVGCPMLCSCQCFGLEAHCEHVVFVESLDLQSRSPTRSLRATPHQRQRGRSSGPVTARAKAALTRRLSLGSASRDIREGSH